MAGKSVKKLDVNTASLAELVAINGVGESLAEKDHCRTPLRQT